MSTRDPLTLLRGMHIQHMYTCTHVHIHTHTLSWGDIGLQESP